MPKTEHFEKVTVNFFFSSKENEKNTFNDDSFGEKDSLSYGVLEVIFALMVLIPKYCFF